MEIQSIYSETERKHLHIVIYQHCKKHGEKQRHTRYLATGKIVCDRCARESVKEKNGKKS